jgi:hypothetical protein
MAQHGMLREYRFVDAAEDIRGSKLYGLKDEKLGQIEDVIFDYSTCVIRYVVVDTGGWLTTKLFIVPAERLRVSAEHKDDFVVDLTKAQVESFPPYKEGDLESDEQWSEYEGRYRSKWEADPVMHRAETDRNITPTTQQMPGNSPSARAASSAEGIEDTGAFTEGGFGRDSEQCGRHRSTLGHVPGPIARTAQGSNSHRNGRRPPESQLGSLRHCRATVRPWLFSRSCSYRSAAVT